MNGTGRIGAELSPRTRRVVYGDHRPEGLIPELMLLATVDRAHVVMLAEQGLIRHEPARRLLTCIDEIVSDDFRMLHARPAPRGTYLMYEGYLIERLGAEVGGVLHTGRSRNDLKATVTSLAVRRWLLDFAEQAARLEAVLLSRARAHRAVIMPAYTHFQAAMPVTYGYYLLGVGLAVGRDVEALVSAADGLRVCPLGAGAAAGTDLPICPERVAGLLGFDSTTRHALDAVASRDALLRILCAVTGLTVTLSRLATDLQLWSTVEFGFVGFPDRLVGGSSAMPQKRNAFLLEHVRARPSEALGALVASASAMAATPFTNTIEVGTESAARIWPGLEAVERAVLLCQVLVSGARPDADRMAARATEGMTTATTIANRLVRKGIPFRSAHRMVGEAVRRAVDAGATAFTSFGPPGWLDGIGSLELPEVVRALSYGGGPGAFAEAYEAAYTTWQSHHNWHRQWRASVALADERLADAVRSMVSTR